MRSRLARCLFTTCLVTVPATALADDRAIAEALFQEGRQLMQSGDHEGALAKLEQSQQTDPTPGTLLNIAVVEERLGRSASAWASYMEAAALAKRAGQPERRDFAEARAAELAPRLSKVTLTLASADARATLTLDDKPLSGGLQGAALPLDPGDHELVVTMPGKLPWRGTVTVPEGPALTAVEIPPLAATPAAPRPSAPATTPRPLAPTPLPQAPSDAGGVSPLVYVGFGVAGAGLVVGAVTGGLALKRASDLEAACPDQQCPEAEHGSLDGTTTLSHASTASFAIAGAGAVLGVVGLFLGGGTQSEGVAVAPLLPVSDGAPGGLVLRGSF